MPTCVFFDRFFMFCFFVFFEEDVQDRVFSVSTLAGYLGTHRVLAASQVLGFKDM